MQLPKQAGALEEPELSQIFSCFTASRAFSFSGFAGPTGRGDGSRELMMYRLPKTSGMLHADTRGIAVPSHRMAHQSATLPIGDRAIVRIDVSDQIVRDELLEVSGSNRTRIHRTVVYGLRIGQHDDHFFRALRERAFDRLRHVDLVAPLLGADGITVQRINDRITAGFLFRVARRQEHQHVAIDGVALQIAFSDCAVDLKCSTVTGFAPGITAGTSVCTCARS